MRLHVGRPPIDATFEPADQGWTSMKEPSPLLLVAIATPACFALAWLVLKSWGPVDSEDTSVSGAEILVGFPLLILAHELVHAFSYPGFGFAVKVVIGVWPSRLLCYAGTNDPVSRNRMLIVYLAPFFFLSIAPLIINQALHVGSFPLMVVAVANAFCCGGDVVVVPIILAQVPGRATLRNNGWRTWWKMPLTDPLV